jgi:hypothetical protein
LQLQSKLARQEAEARKQGRIAAGVNPDEASSSGYYSSDIEDWNNEEYVKE